tara:strand:+ start:154 stop:825 length:672 start_codon:yes stop_codon:yes gene_type:complete
MKPYILFILFSSFLVGSQTPISKSIGEFSELKIFDRINVELIESTENKIEITGQNITDVSIIQKNELLKIKMDLNKVFNGDKTFIKLFYTKINTIDANEGAKVFSDSTFKQYELELKTQEGAEISVNADTNILSIKSVTGGVIKASGSTKSQNIYISTGGVYDAGTLTAMNSKIKIKAGGEADIKTTEFLEVNIVAGGDLIVRGKPKKTKQTSMIGGTISYED